jgi:hypothetical protein
MNNDDYTLKEGTGMKLAKKIVFPWLLFYGMFPVGICLPQRYSE